MFPQSCVCVRMRLRVRALQERNSQLRSTIEVPAGESAAQGEHTFQVPPLKQTFRESDNPEAYLSAIKLEEIKKGGAVMPLGMIKVDLKSYVPRGNDTKLHVNKTLVRIHTNAQHITAHHSTPQHITAQHSPHAHARASTPHRR